MRDKLENIFLYLDENAIQYFLLRPIDLNKKFEDIDLIIPKSDFNKLVKLLDQDSKNIFFKYSNANESIQLFIDDVLLDIKFNICFLPRKTLVLNDSFPYCSVVVKKNRYIYPDVKDEVLFTFWTYHLLLDKVSPNFSSTYMIYKSCYSTSWDKLINSAFFVKWTRLIFNNNSAEGIRLIKLFFSNNMMNINKLDNKKMQKLAIQSNRLIFKFYLDKYYFKLLRLSGFIKKRRTILEIKDRITHEV